jgi:hypothetical protein
MEQFRERARGLWFMSRICEWEDSVECDEKKPCSDCKEAVKQITAALLEASKPKWVSVEERLPEERIDVLIATAHTTGEGVYVGDGKWVWADGGQVAAHPVIAWMPLPAAPQEGEQVAPSEAPHE